MMNSVSGCLRTSPADVAVALFCSCRASLLEQSQQLSSKTQHTLWPVQRYSTATEENTKRPRYIKDHNQPDPRAIAAKLRDAAPVQPTHRILKVIMQSETPLTSHQLYEKIREEFGATAFPTRNGFKACLQQLQGLHWVRARPPPKAATTTAGTTTAAAKPQKKGKSTAVKDPFVYICTPRALQVDLNAPGTYQQQAARSTANWWTAQNLSRYTDMLQERKVPVTLDNFAMIPRAARGAFQRDLR